MYLATSGLPTATLADAIRPLILLLLLCSAASAQDEKIRLWLRGDDFGYTHASNMAMEKAFEEGFMSSASLLVPGPWFSESAAMAVAHPDWNVGVHLTITSEWNVLRWRPVSPISAVPSLVAADGHLYTSGYRPGPADPAGLRATHMPNLAEVEREFRAQIARARSSGLEIQYVDCHMGMACREDMLPITRKIAADNCVPIAGRQTFPEMQNFGLNWDQRTPAEGHRLLEAELRKLTPGLWMYVAHPAADTPELRAVDTNSGERWARQRSSVLALWTDPQIRQLIDELGIELVGPRDLFDYQTCAPK
ncbi:MAG: ChbG/HpnK family deacetylase [Acidobacteria bacterium]|nr:ChbG/HpnK family deacetylase [Acidobacteriota bacterium]